MTSDIGTTTEPRLLLKMPHLGQAPGFGLWLDGGKLFVRGRTPRWAAPGDPTNNVDRMQFFPIEDITDAWLLQSGLCATNGSETWLLLGWMGGGSAHDERRFINLTPIGASA